MSLHVSVVIIRETVMVPAEPVSIYTPEGLALVH
jgi:hypothetical protein